MHFLHSGRYETINSALEHGTSVVEREYKRSVLVYQASKTYKLPALEDLARKYIEYFDGELSLLSMLRIIREVFSKLPQDETWLPSYLKKNLQRSFESSKSGFNFDEIYSAVGQDHCFDNALMKIMLEILSNRVWSLENYHNNRTEASPTHENVETMWPSRRFTNKTKEQATPIESSAAEEWSISEKPPVEARFVESHPAEERPPVQSAAAAEEWIITEEPLAGEPLAGEPLAGEPLAGEPLAGEPLAGEPLAGEPLAGEPLAGEPPTEEPLAGEPPTEEPLAGESPTEEPLAGEPPTEEPLAGESPTEEPLAGEPPTEEPLAGESPTEEPLAGEPPTEEPLAGEPPTEEPLLELSAAQEWSLVQAPPVEEPSVKSSAAEKYPVQTSPASALLADVNLDENLKSLSTNKRKKKARRTKAHAAKGRKIPDQDSVFSALAV